MEEIEISTTKLRFIASYRSWSSQKESEILQAFFIGNFLYKCHFSKMAKFINSQILCALSILIFSFSVHAQDIKPPHLKGEVEIGLSAGRISADTCLDGDFQSPIVFGLNQKMRLLKIYDPKTGQNLKYKKSTPADFFWGMASRYEVLSHQSEFCVRYEGQFTVIHNQSAPGDWKSEIAFNDIAFRSSEYNAWVPLLADSQNQSQNRMSYDVTMSCDECDSLYLNGSKPMKGQQGRFQSQTPWDLFVYAGKFSFQKIEGYFFIGNDWPKEKIKLSRRYSRQTYVFLKKWMGKSIDEKPVFLEFEALAPDLYWAFATLPTIAYTKLILEQNLSAPVKQSYGELPSRLPNMARSLYHEVSHFYFGGRLKPNTNDPMFWYLLESSAEYLAMKNLQQNFGELAYQFSINKKLDAIKTSLQKEPPLLSGKAISSSARYEYGPLTYIALEHKIGEAKMRLFFQQLTEKFWNKNLSYSEFRATLVEVVGHKTINEWEQNCLKTNNITKCDSSFVLSKMGSVK